jgi:ketosteroid isomerase-like protein
MGKNLTTVQGIYSAFAAGDLPAVLGMMDESIEWAEAEGNPWGGEKPFVGPQAVVDRVLVRIPAETDGFTATPQRFTETEDGCLVEGRYTGTAKATGQPFDLQFAHVWRLSGDKIVSFQQYIDTAAWRRVLGADEA